MEDFKKAREPFSLSSMYVCTYIHTYETRRPRNAPPCPRPVSTGVIVILGFSTTRINWHPSIPGPGKADNCIFRDHVRTRTHRRA